MASTTPIAAGSTFDGGYALVVRPAALARDCCASRMGPTCLRASLTPSEITAAVMPSPWHTGVCAGVLNGYVQPHHNPITTPHGRHTGGMQKGTWVACKRG